MMTSMSRFGASQLQRRLRSSVGIVSAIIGVIAGAPLLHADDPGGDADANRLFEESIPGSTVTFRMVKVPAGTVEVNDPENPGQTKTVEVGPFWIGETELPWEAFDLYVFKLDEESNDAADAVSRPSKPYLPPDRGFGHNGYPAISMTYQSAAQFCNWLSAKTGRTYRLPTEAEWQYAIGAGATGDYSYGNDTAQLKNYAWFETNSKWKSHPVGKKLANKWGIYDGHGNVGEWVTGLNGGPVTCGGSFLDPPDMLTLSARRKKDATWQMSDPQIPKSSWWLADCTFIGFRVLCEVEDGQRANANETPAEKSAAGDGNQ